MVSEAPPAAVTDQELLELLYAGDAEGAYAKLRGRGVLEDDARDRVAAVAFAELKRLPSPALAPRTRVAMIMSLLMGFTSLFASVLAIVDLGGGAAWGFLGLLILAFAALLNLGCRHQTVNRFSLGGLGVGFAGAAGIAAAMEAGAGGVGVLGVLVLTAVGSFMVAVKLSGLNARSGPRGEGP